MTLNEIIKNDFLLYVRAKGWVAAAVVVVLMMLFGWTANSGSRPNDLILISYVALGGAIAALFYAQSIYGLDYQFWANRFLILMPLEKNLYQKLIMVMVLYFILSLPLFLIASLSLFSVWTYKSQIFYFGMHALGACWILWFSLINSTLNPLPFSKQFMRISWSADAFGKRTIIIALASLSILFGTGYLFKWLDETVWIMMVSGFMIFTWIAFPKAVRLLSKVLYKERFAILQKLRLEK
jgi:hypothetical protein